MSTLIAHHGRKLPLQKTGDWRFVIAASRLAQRRRGLAVRTRRRERFVHHAVRGRYSDPPSSTTLIAAPHEHQNWPAEPAFEYAQRKATIASGPLFGGLSRGTTI